MANDGNRTLQGYDLVRSIFELRHRPSYLLWDSAGHLAMQLVRLWPELEAVEASPSKILFNKGQQIQLSIEPGRTRVFGHRCGPQYFARTAKEFITRVSSSLDLVSFTRVGYRTIWKQETQSKTEASAMLSKLGWLSFPRPPVKDPIVRGPSYGMRFENESIGIHTKVRVEEQTKRIDVQFGMDFDPIAEVSHFAVVDVDYYTQKLVKLNQLKVTEWIGQVHNQVESHIQDVLRGRDG